MTDTPMTPDRLKAIDARVASATEGPWVTMDGHEGQRRGHEIRQGEEYGDFAAFVAQADPACGCNQCAADTEFISHARQDVPDLRAEVDRLRGELSDATAELAENTRAMNAIRRHRDTAESRLAAMERLAEEADGKCNPTVDTYLLLDALGLNADTPSDARVADELAEGLAGLDAMRADHPAPCRVPDSPDCTCPAQCQDCGAPAPAAGTRMWHRIGCPQRETR